jgi:hypothetical protein
MNLLQNKRELACSVRKGFAVSESVSLGRLVPEADVGLGGRLKSELPLFPRFDF